MYDQKVYWVWLQQALGYANAKVRTVVLLHKTAKNFYNAGVNEWRLCGCFSKRELNAFEKYTLDEAKQLLDKCKKLNQTVITIESPEYPSLLKHIDAPPCVLYIRGKLPQIDNNICIAIVGTRSATPYGLSASFNFGFELAKKGAIVVSGGALGVDSEAHKGALQGGGKTIAVLGCGINTNYLMGNAWLRREISKNGAVVSEYPPDYPGYARNFPVRNRIISGLALGTVVVEANEKSGSLITANIALEQNRDVFSVPGNILSSTSSGTNTLIKLGAIPVTNADDILLEYSNLGLTYSKLKGLDGIKKEVIDTTKKEHDINKNEEKKQKVVNSLSKDAGVLYKALLKEPLHIDKLSEITKIKPNKLLQAVTELELNNLIDCHSGRRYSIK